MKLVYIIHGLYNSGGMEKILSQKASALALEYGHDVTIITSEQKGRAPFFPLSDKVHTRDLGVNYHLPLFHRRLRAALMDIRPDITISLCGGEIHRLHTIPDGSKKVAELHFSHQRYHFRPGKGALHNLIAKARTSRLEKAASRLDAFVVLTRKDMETWRSCTSGANLHQIYNFIDETPLRSTLENKRCISIGRLIPSKNFPELIEAWKKVDARHPDWSLDIYGRGGLKDSLNRLIDEAGLSGKVIIHDPVRNILEKIAESSIFVTTILNEGMCMALAEGASAGLPQVSYDIPCGPSEIIIEDETGFLVSAHDTDALADRICRLIEDPEMRKRMGAAALAANSRFSRSEIVRQWDEFFTTIDRDRRHQDRHRQDRHRRQGLRCCRPKTKR